MSRSVVLLSGGLDSAVCAALELEAGREVWLLFFHYGQRHRWAEFRASKLVAQDLGIEGRLVTRAMTQLLGSALTGTGDLSGAGAVVPDRNLALLSQASNYAQAIRAERVVIGVSATDHAGFADCRPEFYERLAGLLATPVYTPLLHRTKREIVAEARRLGVPMGLTWSCYAGGERPCGECGACAERAKAEVA